MEDGDYDAEGAFGDDGADYAAPPDDDGEDLGGGELVLSAVKQRFQADLNVLIAAISARVVPDKVDLPKVRQEAPACMDQLLTKWKARQSTTVNVTLRAAAVLSVLLALFAATNDVCLAATTTPVEVLLVTDEPGIEGNATMTLERNAAIFAPVRALFGVQLNITLILRNQILLEEADLEAVCSPHGYYQTEDLLRDCFELYLTDRRADAENVDVSILLSGRRFTNKMGKSHRGGACQSGAKHALVPLFWDDGTLLIDSLEYRTSVLAYHLARLLGASDSPAECTNETSVMDGPDTFPPLHFASCAATDIRGFLGSGAPASCLTAPPPDALAWDNYTQCGNGVVEPGEACDSSGPCCEACEFVGNATCDPGSFGFEVCCTEECGVAAVGTGCRASALACDSVEKCSGENGWCPLDYVLEECFFVVVEQDAQLDPVVLAVVLGSLAAFIGVLGVAAWRGAKGVGYKGVPETTQQH